MRGVPMARPGLVDGRHYTTYTEDVRRLKRIGDHDAAERLLLRLVDATEEETQADFPIFHRAVGLAVKLRFIEERNEFETLDQINQIVRK